MSVMSVQESKCKSIGLLERWATQPRTDNTNIPRADSPSGLRFLGNSRTGGIDWPGSEVGASGGGMLMLVVESISALESSLISSRT